MQYEELHSRYGTIVSQRVRRELTPTEFNGLDIDALAVWLEARAETAHEEYRSLLSNPLVASNVPNQTGEACRRWREAEDLAYLVAIAEDVGANLKIM